MAEVTNEIVSNDFKHFFRDAYNLNDASKLNPSLKRFFATLYQMMLGQLIVKFGEQLELYLKFILSFAITCEDFKNSTDFKELNLD